MPTASEAAKHDATWEARCPEDWLSRSPRVQLAFYHESMFTSITQKIKPGKTSWVARVDVKTRNVPRLMREGLHWSDANVQKELSYFERNISASAIPSIHSGEQHDGWTNLRKYFLVSLDTTTNWTAEITVYTKSVAVLSEFELCWLTAENLGLTYATNWDGKMVYMYRKWQAENTYLNAIYGNMPLKGWWPWPKAVEADVTVMKEGDGETPRAVADQSDWEEL